MTDLPQEFSVSILHVGGHSNVRVTGEIDLATATELGQRLNLVIAAGTGDADLDLSDVTFLDSSGLAVLLAARQELHDKHRQLTLRNPSKPVLRALELCGVLDLVTQKSRQSPSDSNRAAEC